MKRIAYFFRYYRSLLKIKIKFKKPNKNKILMFDYTNEILFKRLIKKKIEVLYIRLEEINFYVLFMAVKSYGF